MCSPLVGSQSNDVSFDCRLTVGSPSGLDAKWKQNPFMRFAVVFALVFVIGVGNAWGANLTLTNDDIQDNATGNGSYSDDHSIDGNWGGRWLISNNKGTYFLQLGYNTSSTKTAYNSHLAISIPSGATSISISISTNNGTASGRTFYACNANNKGYVNSGTGDYGYGATAAANGTASISITGSPTIVYIYPNGTTYIASVTVSYTTGASCGTDPTVGTASLNGSFTLSSVPLTCTASPGTGCSISAAGFVWKTGSAPSSSDNPTTGTYSTNITGTIPSAGSLTLGTTYYIKAYATNSHGTTYSTSSFLLTPRSVTFHKNDGSATTSTQYVNNGVATALTANVWSRTGYIFNGWNTNADGKSGTNYADEADVTASGANVDLYAKWTAKTTTVTLDNQSATTAGASSVTATYDAAVPSIAADLPAKTGYTFGGYYTSTGGGGTQYIKADGTSAKNWDITDVTKTLYAKWTVKSFTVTWMVNGEAYTTGDPSNSVDFGSHVSKLPTAPTPPCGDKFMGWTTTNIGAIGQATDTGLNLFTTADSAPTISAEGNVTYYAVFADYDE